MIDLFDVFVHYLDREIKLFVFGRSSRFVSIGIENVTKPFSSSNTPS